MWTLTATTERPQRRSGSVGKNMDEHDGWEEKHSFFESLRVLLGDWWWNSRDRCLAVWRCLKHLLRNMWNNFMGFNGDLHLYSTVSQTDLEHKGRPREASSRWEADVVNQGHTKGHLDNALLQPWL